MLLKGVGPDGFCFYTNYESRKGGELGDEGPVALVFHWKALQRQVRIEGIARKMSEEASLAYFHSRPRGSQVGAWASRQSRVLEARSELEEAVREYKTDFKGQDVPLPPYWGGFRVDPERIEFWQGRADRLHDRLCYIRQEDRTWRVVRLSP